MSKSSFSKIKSLIVELPYLSAMDKLQDQLDREKKTMMVSTEKEAQLAVILFWHYVANKDLSKEDAFTKVEEYLTRTVKLPIQYDLAIAFVKESVNS